MPMNNWPPWVFHHLLPVLQLEPLAVVPQQDLPDGVRGADAVVVRHHQLKVHPLRREQDWVSRMELRVAIILPEVLFWLAW